MKHRSLELLRQDILKMENLGVDVTCLRESYIYLAANYLDAMEQVKKVRPPSNGKMLRLDKGMLEAVHDRLIEEERYEEAKIYRGLIDNYDKND